MHFYSISFRIAMLNPRLFVTEAWATAMRRHCRVDRMPKEATCPGPTAGHFCLYDFTTH